MDVRVSHSALEGVVDAPPSKSYTHRAVAIASLGRRTRVLNPLVSDDTRSTMHACRMLGAEVERMEDHIQIRGTQGKVTTPDNIVDVGNSGTTLRIMSAVSALANGAVVLTGDASIRRRPNNPLIVALNDLGADAFSTRNNGMAPLVVRGKLRGGKTFIDGSVSSQFITGLLIACPFAERERDTEIVVRGTLKSRPYVDITLEMLKDAGVEITVEEGVNLTFKVAGGQDLHVSEYRVPGDFSSASYLLAAGALFGELTVSNMYPTAQGDSAIIQILEEMGADITWNKNKGIVKVRKSRLTGCVIDVGETPDLLPTLAVLGALAEGTTTIKNAKHVRYKETDRIHAIATELAKMGAILKEEEDSLTIEGSKLHSAQLDGWDDHRIVMALTLAGIATGNTTINTAESVKISYPNFFEDIKSLGAIIETNT
ncbi:3-phosphoshikimate 1-carboxyvinyltransferase [Methanosarcinales archaeon ex4572_44]|nr:MAG: 3-phosphoshikimate 1-carboxyvinyltransferase [Methanosarcinales archaeon ex4484_138]PHP45544.1 MAG: 3-phosphoshikimate 1-carboxyvinyltransferase [Methanosarcinales archaeon ex4572_44]RLG24691.1 MAG: 3-phosphoshikimate 1-carboxyvinyltransferase [Methanosarcinales archaeon]